MSSASAPQQSISDDISHWLRYIECAECHPRPLPSGSHVFRTSLEASPAVSDLYRCLYKLYTEESAAESFREPVNALALGVFTYYERITAPMSLRAVLDGIVAGDRYATIEQILADIELIWANCETFNGPSAVVTTKARRCAATLQRLRDALADEQLAPSDEVNRLVDCIEANNDGRMLAELIAHFEREDPALLIGRELVIEQLKVKHVRAMRAIIDRYLTS